MAFLPRVCLVTRRFWPLVGGPETLALGLGGELRQRGCAVTVFTPTWNPAWPRQLEVDGIRVERVRGVPSPGIDAVCYVREIAQRIAARRGDFDLLYVSGLGYEAIAALRAAGGAIPVILRAERAGPRGDCQQRKSRFAGHFHRRCRKAAAIVAPWQSIADELAAAGYPNDRIRRIANGVPVAPPRDAQRRRQARAILASTHAALDVPESVPLAVHVGEIEAGRGLGRLVSAWAKVHAAHPRARLWLVGEGCNAKYVQRAIDEANLRGRVLMTGSFDAVGEILAAADLAVFPLLAPGTHTAVLEAMAAGLPVVAGATPESLELLDHGRGGLLCDLQTPDALAAACERILAEPSLAASLGEAGRSTVQRRFALPQMADAHLALFREAVNSSPQAG